MVMKKINKVEVLLELEGKGLVNYNGSKVPKRFKGDMYVNGKVTSNGTFGKEHIYRRDIIDSKGEKKNIEIPKKIISDNLLRKEICGDENLVNADKLVNIPKLRVALLSQDNVIVRGFAVMGKGDDISLKRKGSLSVSDAEQISDTVTWLETRTAEGKRDETSLFFKETCGDIKYKSEIRFDIKQLQFISIDDNYDRMSLKETDVAGFIGHIDKRYGAGNATFGNWGTTHKNVIGEQGIVLSDKVVANVIRETIKRILEINILRSGSYAKTSSVKVAVGYAGDDINLLAKPKYVNINTIKDYDELVAGEVIGVDYLPIVAPVIEKVEKQVKKKVEKRVTETA